MLVDEHFLAVEVDTGLHPAHTQGLEVVLGHKEQGIDGQRRISGKMEAEGGFIIGIADELIEFVVLFVRDFALGAAPDGLNRVDLFPFHFDRKGDKGGVLFDDAFQGELLAVLFSVVFQLNNDFGAPVQAVARADGIGAVAVGMPFMAFAAVPGAGLDGDGLCRHKGGVKAYAELADQADILFGRLCQLFDKFAGPGMSNSTQVFLKLLRCHADTGIGDGQGVFFVIAINIDLQRDMGVEFRLLGQGKMAEFLQGIRGIGDQLTDKDVSFGVE